MSGGWQVVGFWIGAAGLVLGLLAFVMERLRRPRLLVREGLWQAAYPTPWHFAEVQIVNRPPSRLIRWIVVRSAADGVRVQITFRRKGAAAPFIPTYDGRWSDTPEPLVDTGQIDQATGRPIMKFDLGLATTHRRHTVPADGEPLMVAVAVLRDDDTAYAWSAESYAYLEWRDRNRKLTHDVYEVTVWVTSASGASAQAVFELPYHAGRGFAEFRVRQVK